MKRKPAWMAALALATILVLAPSPAGAGLGPSLPASPTEIHGPAAPSVRSAAGRDTNKVQAIIGPIPDDTVVSNPVSSTDTAPGKPSLLPVVTVTLPSQLAGPYHNDPRLKVEYRVTQR